MSKIKFIEIGSEICAGTRGASLGPGAIRIASLNSSKDKFFYNRTPQVVPNQNHLLLERVKHHWAKRIHGLQRVFTALVPAVAGALAEGQFPFVLAGDHSTAAATIAGIKSFHKNKRLGVIWVDAHADLHSPYTTPSGNMHGMPLAIALSEDNLPERREPREFHPDTVRLWTSLKEMGVSGPNIKPEDLVFIGVRDTEREEEALMKRLNIRNITVAELQANGAVQAAKQALEHLAECDIIYVSFDVDSMDSGVSKGTGTPVPCGLMPGEATAILRTFAADPRTCCMEIVEVNPCLDDRRNLMAETAFHILHRVTEVIEKN